MSEIFNDMDDISMLASYYDEGGGTPVYLNNGEFTPCDYSFGDDVEEQDISSLFPNFDRASLTTNGTSYTNYETVQEAIDAAGTTSGSIVTMLYHSTENINIASGQNLTLDLAGYTLMGTGTTFVVSVYGNLTLKDSKGSGRITGGSGSNGGGMYIRSGGVVTMESGRISGNTASGHGGGVYLSSGTLIMNGGTISDNYAGSEGGGVRLASTSVFTMNDGLITGNSSSGGGGVMFGTNGTFNFNGGTISNNYSTAHSGGIYGYYGAFTMTGGLVTGNRAATYGGCGRIQGCESNMSGGEIVNNEAGSYAGGLALLTEGTFAMSGGTITENTATTYGGGINVTVVTFTMTGGDIYNNTAGSYASDVGFASSATVTLKDISSSGLKDAQGHTINGWYLDNSEDRWSEDNITDKASGLTFSSTAANLIAAHGAL